MESCIILVVIGSEDSFSMDITIKRYFRNIAEIQHAMYRQRIVTIAHLICFLWYHDFIDIPVYRRRDEWLTSEKCLNREREYGTMRYGRGMVTGRDFKKRGCREDSCIILFAPLFVPLSKLARANAICESQHEESGGEIMKSDIDYIKIASFNRNEYVGRSKSLNIGTIFFFSLVLQEFS